MLCASGQSASAAEKDMSDSEKSARLTSARWPSAPGVATVPATEPDETLLSTVPMPIAAEATGPFDSTGVPTAAGAAVMPELTDAAVELTLGRGDRNVGVLLAPRLDA